MHNQSNSKNNCVRLVSAAIVVVVVVVVAWWCRLSCVWAVGSVRTHSQRVCGGCRVCVCMAVRPMCVCGLTTLSTNQNAFKDTVVQRARKLLSGQSRCTHYYLSFTERGVTATLSRRVYFNPTRDNRVSLDNVCANHKLRICPRKMTLIRKVTLQERHHHHCLRRSTFARRLPCVHLASYCSYGGY